MEIRPEVLRGAALLDEKWGGRREWADKVKPSKLDMCSNCVLDHVYGSYARGLNDLGLYDPMNAVGSSGEYGFNLKIDQYGGPGESGEWDRLRAEWIALISG